MWCDDTCNKNDIFKSAKSSALFILPRQSGMQSELQTWKTFSTLNECCVVVVFVRQHAFTCGKKGIFFDKMKQSHNISTFWIQFFALICGRISFTLFASWFNDFVYFNLRPDKHNILSFNHSFIHSFHYAWNCFAWRTNCLLAQQRNAAIHYTLAG